MGKRRSRGAFFVNFSAEAYKTVAFFIVKMYTISILYQISK